LGKRIVFFLLPEVFGGLKYADNAIAAGDPPRTPLGSGRPSPYPTPLAAFGASIFVPPDTKSWRRHCYQLRCSVNGGTMGVNSLPKTRQHRDCGLNPGPSAPESSTLTTRLPSHPSQLNLPHGEYHMRIADGGICLMIHSAFSIERNSVRGRRRDIKADDTAPLLHRMSCGKYHSTGRWKRGTGKRGNITCTDSET